MNVHIPLLIFCIVLCLLPLKNKTKTKWIMPICMLMITVYMAIRYDYGLDFWSYYKAFTDKQHRTSTTEPLFWMYKSLHPKYFMLVASSSILLMCAIYSWVKKYIPPQYYALFFLCFMCIPGMCFSMMTAMRSVMAFVIMSWGIYKYYIQKNKPGSYAFVVILAAMMHNSAIVFLLVPLVDKIVRRLSPYTLFGLFIVFSIFSFTGTAQDISTYIFNQLYGIGIIDAEYYSVYATKYVSNINGAIFRASLLFPMYFICYFSSRIKDVSFQRFYVLCVYYMLIYTLSLDMEYRFTLYMFIFFIIAISMCLPKMSVEKKLIAVIPMVAFCVYHLNGYYHLMRAEMYGDYSEGNFFIYKTIFENLPLI